MEFIIFEKGKQREYLLKIKEKSQLSWPKLAKLIGKSRSTILTYLREDCKVPMKVIDKLNSKYDIKVEYEKVISLKNTKKEIKFPKLSNKFAELIGAIAGDGHLHLYPAELSITCHKDLDREHVYHLSKIFENLFNQKPKILFQRNIIKLRFYSKELVNKLNQEYELPIGRKMNRLRIPSKILIKQSYLISFIRGLFDTDGTINRHHKNSGAIVEISSRDPIFLKDINKALISLNLSTSVNYKGVKIYAKSEIDRFFKLIKPSNPKHNLKYTTFKRTKLVPSTREIHKALIV